MVVSDGDFGPMGIEKIDETSHVWLYGREKYLCRPISLDISEYETLRRSHRESSRELDISLFWLSRDRYSGISVCSRISDLEESVHEDIDRPFSDIASSRIWEFYRSECTQESRNQEDTRSDFARQVEVDLPILHSTRIDGKSMILESNLYSGTLCDSEKSVYVTDIRDVMDGGFLKEKGSTDKRKCGILGSTYLHASSECLSSGDFEHI